MTKTKFIELCEARGICPRLAFETMCESIKGRIEPDLNSVESVIKWLDENF